MMDYSDFEDHYVGEYLMKQKATKKELPSGRTLVGLSLLSGALAFICIITITTLTLHNSRLHPEPRRDSDDVSTELADKTTASVITDFDESTEVSPVPDTARPANMSGVTTIMGDQDRRERIQPEDGTPSQSFAAASNTSKEDW
ncbi:uncharacterized protein LOC135398115 isoform X2 [Ornithodoros turicata]|uniref:uncharacterized protein LOC135398115 isoform X2 n=1 Tax=Ornithodoros turicata TaxID=34597 RepID=UPI00313A12B1